MSRIVLNEEQARLLTSSNSPPVEVCDQSGLLLGHISLSNDAEMIALANERRASRQPGIPSQKVKLHLEKLDDAARNGATKQELKELSNQLLESAKNEL